MGITIVKLLTRPSLKAFPALFRCSALVLLGVMIAGVIDPAGFAAQVRSVNNALYFYFGHFYLWFVLLTLGMFIFAFANGTLEAVANPLVATLFPNNRTHVLNILHASWPAGIVAGSSLETKPEGMR